MDPKGSAKSKRTHSQHGRKNHPTPSAIAQKKKNPSKIGGTEEKSARRTLPSNWDRYQNSDDEGVENPVDSGKQIDGKIAPKSKGADFRFLIEQARCQPQELRNPSYGSGSLSFDDFPSDFMQGVSSILFVRGKNILSCCEDDNFIVDDDTTSSYEVPFLTMDLHALAAQLSKLKLSQRLFIEADLLPEEQCAGESQKGMVSEERSETQNISEHEHSSDALAFTGYPVYEKVHDSRNKVGSSDVVNYQKTEEGGVAGNVPCETNRMQGDKLVPSNDSKLPEQSSIRGVQEVKLGDSFKAIEDTKQVNPSRFEAAAAESDLDMLLDSFGQSSLPGSSADDLSRNSFTALNVTSSSTDPMGQLSASPDPGSLRNAATTSLDEVIDDLLAETSLCLKDKKHSVYPRKKEADVPTSLPSLPLSSGPTAASNTWRHAAASAGIDESIDDLLGVDTLCLGDRKQTAVHPRKEGALAAPSMYHNHSSGLGLKVDDFDSWLDTL